MKKYHYEKETPLILGQIKEDERLEIAIIQAKIEAKKLIESVSTIKSGDCLSQQDSNKDIKPIIKNRLNYFTF